MILNSLIVVILVLALAGCVTHGITEHEPNKPYYFGFGGIDKAVGTCNWLDDDEITYEQVHDIEKNERAYFVGWYNDKNQIIRYEKISRGKNIFSNECIYSGDKVTQIKHIDNEGKISIYNYVP